MNYIWEVSLKSCGYGGEDGYSEAAERKFLFNNDYFEWLKNRKRLFSERSDAEAYVRPIVAKAFEYLLSDWEYRIKSSSDDEEYFTELTKLYKKRGLQEFRTESLDEENLFYSSAPHTTFLVPWDYEDDRDGENFASISRVILH